MQLDCNCVRVTAHQDCQAKSCIDWSTVDGEVIAKYRNNTTTALSNLVLDHDTLICPDINVY